MRSRKKRQQKNSNHHAAAQNLDRRTPALNNRREKGNCTPNKSLYADDNKGLYQKQAVDDNEIVTGSELNNEINTDEKVKTKAQQPLYNIPQFAVLPNDPSLANLMMSWYWAGYYTALYESKIQQS